MMEKNSTISYEQYKLLENTYGTDFVEENKSSILQIVLEAKSNAATLLGTGPFQTIISNETNYLSVDLSKLNKNAYSEKAMSRLHDLFHMKYGLLALHEYLGQELIEKHWEMITRVAILAGPLSPVLLDVGVQVVLCIEGSTVTSEHLEAYLLDLLSFLKSFSREDVGMGHFLAIIHSIVRNNDVKVVKNHWRMIMKYLMKGKNEVGVERIAQILHQTLSLVKKTGDTTLLQKVLESFQYTTLSEENFRELLLVSEKLCIDSQYGDYTNVFQQLHTFLLSIKEKSLFEHLFKIITSYSEQKEKRPSDELLYTLHMYRQGLSIFLTHHGQSQWNCIYEPYLKDFFVLWSGKQATGVTLEYLGNISVFMQQISMHIQAMSINSSVELISIFKKCKVLYPRLPCQFFTLLDTAGTLKEVSLLQLEKMVEKLPREVLLDVLERRRHVRQEGFENDMNMFERFGKDLYMEFLPLFSAIDEVSAKRVEDVWGDIFEDEFACGGLEQEKKFLCKHRNELLKLVENLAKDRHYQNFKLALYSLREAYFELNIAPHLSTVNVHRAQPIINPRSIATRDTLIQRIEDLIDQEYSREGIESYTELLAESLFILSHPSYVQFLSQQGVEYLKKAEELYKKIEIERCEWSAKSFLELKDILAHTPTASNPQIELFVPLSKKVQDLFWSGYDGFTCPLTNACANNCVFCQAMSVQQKLEHARFPLIAKAVIEADIYAWSKYKTVKESDGWAASPYYNTEPGQYHDKVLNAVLSDVTKLSPFVRRFVTHGEGGVFGAHGEGLENVSKVYEGIPATTNYEVSLHVLHPDVKRFAQSIVFGKPSQEQLSQKRDALIKKYVERFLPIFKAYADGYGQINEVRTKYYTYKSFVYKLNCDQKQQFGKQIEVLEIMDMINQEVLKEVKRSMEEYYIENKTENRRKVIINTTTNGGLLLEGKSVDLLISLGFPDEVVRSIAEEETLHISKSDYLMELLPSGEMELALVESNVQKYRMVTEMFSSYHDPHFVLLTEVLYQYFTGVHVNDTRLTELYGKTCIRSFTKKIVSEISMIEGKHCRSAGYMKVVEAFFLSDTALEEIKKPFQERNLELLFCELSNVPFPTRYSIHLMREANSIKEQTITMNVAMSKNPNLEQNHAQSMRYFKSPYYKGFRKGYTSRP